MTSVISNKQMENILAVFMYSNSTTVFGQYIRIKLQLCCVGLQCSSLA